MDTDRSKQVDEVHRRIGRNLLRFQAIETGLKLILPYIHPDGSAKGVEALRAYRERIRSKTLGQVLQEFEVAVTVSEGFFGAHLDVLLEARNRLVHQFFKLPDVDVLNPHGTARTLEYLEKQFEDAEMLSTLVRALSSQVLLGIMEQTPSLMTEFGPHYERLIRELPPDVEYIDQSNPTRTRWRSTRIVKLLQEAERATERVDGMALLSRAGRFLREQSPELTAKRYGLKTLRQILMASGLFDVITAADGTTILYRSRVGENAA